MFTYTKIILFSQKKMATKPLSRRNFIFQNAKLGAGAFLAPSLLSLNSYNNRTIVKNEDAEPIIDIHQHTNYYKRADDDLVAHQRALGISITVLQPAGHPKTYGSTYFGLANGLECSIGPNEDAYALAQRYPGEFLFAANEIPDLPGAIDEIEKYLKLGAKMIGESKFGVECDSPAMQQIYRLADKYDVPVLMHWLYNTYNRSFERFEKMVKKYKHVNFIGHAQTWWAHIDKNQTDDNNWYPTTKVTPGGLTDRLLDYPNVWGDLSAGSGFNSLNRDTEHAKGFLTRHQDKLLFGSDCWDTTAKVENNCAGAKTIQLLRKISPSKAIERKILYENAKKLLKL